MSPPIFVPRSSPCRRASTKSSKLIGTSTKSWEEAAKIAVELTAEHLRELRVAEVVEQDLVITDGKVEALPHQGQSLLQI